MKPLLLILSVLLTFASVYGQDSSHEIENKLPPSLQVKGEPVMYRSIPDRMNAYNVPGMSVAIVHEGKIVYAKAFGIAQEGIPVTNNTLFQAGSISKPLAALAVLKLKDQGRVDLDEDVNTYLTSWKIPANDFNEPVTLRRLLTHTAGMTVHGFPGYKPSDTFPSDIEVLDGEGNTGAIFVDTEPGSIWRYSGGGYTVMERVVEDVSGMEFSVYLETEILRPMGMEISTYAQPLPESRHKEASAAFDGNGELIEGDWHNYPEQAAAGLWTTPSELATYLIHIQNILDGKPGIIERETVLEMLSKDKNEWGLGPGLANEADSIVFRHGGKNAGFTNLMGGYAYLGGGAVVMTNADRGGGLMNETMIAISDHYGWNLASPRVIELITADEELLASVVGTYIYDGEVPGVGEYIVTLALEEGELILDDPNESITYHFSPMKENRFIDIEKNETIELRCSDANSCDGFVWNGTYNFKRKTD